MSSNFNFGMPVTGTTAYSAAVNQFATVAPLEKVPHDETDKKLYMLERACGVGPPVQMCEALKKQTPVVPETTERPLTRLRELLRPYRKSEYGALDRISTYAFRKILYEQRDGEPRTFDPRLMTEAEWKDEYGDCPKEPKRFENSTVPPIPLTPVAVDGFAQLAKRLEIQQQNLSGKGESGADSGHEGFTKVVGRAIVQLQLLEGQEHESQEKIERLREKSRTQLQRLLRVARSTELVAFQSSTRGRDENSEEAALRAKLTRLLQELQREQQLGPRIDDLYQRVSDREHLLASVRAPPEEPIVPGGAPSGRTQRGAGGVGGGIDEATRAHLGRMVGVLGDEVMRLQASVGVASRHIAVATKVLGPLTANDGANIYASGAGRRAVQTFDGGYMFEDPPT